jgi:hypothetical protein
MLLGYDVVYLERQWKGRFGNSAVLLGKIGSELTLRQREIVDRFKQHCPGYAIMRKLVLSFRTILRVGKLATLHGWMERALKTGIHALQRFVRTLKQDMGAVEAAVTERWSNGPVEANLILMTSRSPSLAGVQLTLLRSSGQIACCFCQSIVKLLAAKPFCSWACQ